MWCADLTYVPLHRGFLYLVAIMDWYSRYVLAWELSNTMETWFCVAALEAALGRARPEIFNTDQGAQFTSEEFTGCLAGAGIRISMDGRGRALDNVFIERLWRSVKYEDIYIRDYRDGDATRAGLTRYFGFYNTQRLHQGLDDRTPEAYISNGSDQRAWTEGMGEKTASENARHRTALLTYLPQRIDCTCNRLLNSTAKG